MGDGPEMNNLKEQVSALGLDKRVKLLGFVKNPASYILGAHALLHASMREGFPNVLLESLSLDTPVIASLSKTGPKEIIFEGKNGLTFPVGDEQKLQGHMEAVLSDQSLYTELKANVQIGLERFTPSRVFNLWENIL